MTEKKFISYVETSKCIIGRSKFPDEGIDPKEVELGCLQRIATATEAMAKNYIQLQKDLEYNKLAAERLQSQLTKAYNRESALKGHITRLRKKAGG